MTIHLYGQEHAEYLQSTPEETYENWICDHDVNERPESLIIEEWSVAPVLTGVPPVDRILDWLADEFGEEEAGTEENYESFKKATKQPEVIAAFDTARDSLGRHHHYRMAKDHLRNLIVTWDAAGEPLLDGQPMYVKRCRGFQWAGQSMAHCEGCGKDISLHDGLDWLKSGEPIFGGGSELIPFDEARQRIPLFAHYVTPTDVGDDYAGPYRYDKEQA